MTSLIVQKYGGSSVAGVEHMRRVAGIVKDTLAEGHKVVAVVSAPRSSPAAPNSFVGVSTDDLVDLAADALEMDRRGLSAAAAEDPAIGREVAALVAIGETFSASLLALALSDCDVVGVSLNALQAGPYTRSAGYFGEAMIDGVETGPIVEALDRGHVPVLAGFQARNDNNELVTLERGCSDTSAVAIAAALKADECQIYTDVAGIYTADPRVVPKARVLPQVHCEEMIEASLGGAQVLHPRSLRLCQRYQIPLRVLSSLEPDQPGTRVVPRAA